MPSAVDLHIHTTASDGSVTPEALPDLLRQRGITTFAITDHDTIDGAVAMLGHVPQGMRFIPGVEFSCESAAGKYHILGYGYRPDDPLLHAAVEEGRQLRRVKLTQRIAYLKREHGIHFTEEETAWLYAQKSPGKPHLGKLLLGRGLGRTPEDMMGVLQTYVNPFKGGKDRIPVETAIRAIHHARGIAVWAHPLGGEGHRHKPPEVFAPLLRDLLDAGIDGMECWYSRYSPQEITFLNQQAVENGLLISGGSDFHGSPKPGLVPGTLCTEACWPEVEELTLLQRL